MTRFFRLGALVFSATLGIAASAGAQTANPADMQYVRAVAQSCPANWGAQACLAAVSASNLVMASNYGSQLQQSGHQAEAEQVKQHCAASTAAMKGNYPAYAFRSADTECANAIADIVQATGQKPDMTLYQLLGTASLCLANDPHCAGLSQQLQAYAH